MQLIAGAPYFGLAAKRCSDAGQLQCVLPVKFQAAAYRPVTEHNIDGDGWGRKETGMGTGGDGSYSIRERVKMDVKSVGTGGMGLKSRGSSSSNISSFLASSLAVVRPFRRRHCTTASGREVQILRHIFCRKWGPPGVSFEVACWRGASVHCRLI